MTIEDAITKYRVHPMFSLEHQKKNLSSFIYNTHSLGNFYSTQKRPITEKMVRECMVSYMGLLTPDEIEFWKQVMRNPITVSMGVDFGSGNSSSTVITILIHWKKPDRLHLAYAEKRPPENQLDQAEYIAKLFKRAKCDVGAGDLGYGTNSIMLIQGGGISRNTGSEYDGVGKTVFVGCRTTKNEVNPIQHHSSRTDEHGQEAPRYTVDKATVIQWFVTLLEDNVFSSGLNDVKLQAKLLIIPCHVEKTYETDWLVKEFTSISRKTVDGENVGDMPRLEYNHPPDSVMSIIYAALALNDKFKWRGGSRIFDSDL